MAALLSRSCDAAHGSTPQPQSKHPGMTEVGGMQVGFGLQAKALA